MSVNISKPAQVRIRATEAEKKTSLTFADLCELVDKGREQGIDPTTVVLGDYWIKHVKDREGYVLKWLEI